MRGRPGASQQPGKPKEGGAISSKVFVGNLDFGTTQEELRTLFSEVGAIVEVALPMDRASGRPRGFAFVQFESAEHAAQAIQKYDGFELSGRRLRVNEASAERPARRPSEGFGRSFPGGDRMAPRSRTKGSRRNIRSRKRSVW